MPRAFLRSFGRNTAEIHGQEEAYEQSEGRKKRADHRGTAEQDPVAGPNNEVRLDHIDLSGRFFDPD